MAKGRPTKYSLELADRICEHIATSNKGIHKIADIEGINPSSIFQWLLDYPDFSNKYARARELQAELLADEIIDIADDSTNDTILTDNGEMPNNEWIARSKLRVDARKWKASKLAPKKYGDKLEHEHKGDVAVTVNFKDAF